MKSVIIAAALAATLSACAIPQRPSMYPISGPSYFAGGQYHPAVIPPGATVKTGQNGVTTVTNADGTSCDYNGVKEECHPAPGKDGATRMRPIDIEEHNYCFAGLGVIITDQSNFYFCAKRSVIIDLGLKTSGSVGVWGGVGPFNTYQEASAALDKANADQASADAKVAAQKAADDKAKADARAKRQAQLDDPKYRAKYLADLEKNYGHVIHFDSPRSMSVVTSFKFPCFGTDHRVMPLYNMILATAASDEKLAAGSGRHMWYEVQSAEGETRVVRGLEGQDRGEVFLSIDKWGELQSTHIEAMKNACAFGTYGPIWIAK